LQAHISTCSNHKDYSHFQTKETLPSHSPKTGTIDFVECDENWSDEPDVKSYNPEVHCKGSMLLRNCTNVPRAQRHEFREKQRQLFKELNGDPELKNKHYKN